ncbi:MAG TPA: pentapeptide repeat-containing protein [Candidatus Bathyarchaeia archaeon]|nr:pentapeptide repeat-containing protein [Candidatus Bathyarchaeia archaeon]
MLSQFCTLYKFHGVALVTDVNRFSADLSHAILSHANLYAANLSSANLTGADISNLRTDWISTIGIALGRQTNK